MINDKFYNFLKKYLSIDDNEIKYIVDLILDNYNSIIDIDDFKNIFMNRYIRNYNILVKFINIKERNFDELINYLNKIKNKAHYYFENVNNNMSYYISIIDYLENTSNILV